MSTEHEVDVVVLGAGPSGEVLAGRLSERGLKVAIVEERLVGGECAYWGCMPSKALLRPFQALDEARRVPGAAEAVTGELDVEAALTRRDEVIHGLDDSAQMPWLDERGVLLVRGHGRLAGERIVQVGDTLLRARRAVAIAVGTAPLIPPVPGLREAQPWTNREAVTEHEVPGSIVVIGGGVVGVELAQAFATLGAEVTLVEVAPRILGHEERFAAEQVRAGLEGKGVTVHEGVAVTGVSRGADGRVTVQTDGAGDVVADEILAASGRRQVTDDLGLASIGLRVADPPEPLEVGDDLRVAGHDWLFVTGDANGKALLTHMGKYQARIAADVMCGRGEARIRGGLPPRVTFTEPQVAAVGHTLDSARTAGVNARAVDVPTQGSAGGSFYGKGVDGTSRIVVDEDHGLIVGATFVGADVAEWLHAATIAVVGEVPLDDLWHAVPVFPTRGEVWLNLLEAYAQEA
jgi:pyruvate/2-oxoglutarate dehydrogenase complex dihydrolipoamide dehydrogenase (E3) component